MTRIRFLVLALAFVLPLLAHPSGAQDAPMTAERLLAALSSTRGFHAHFTEEKRIALLAVPLRAEGELFFAPPGQLLRRVTGPTPSATLIDGDRLILEAAGERQEHDLSSSPVLRAFVHSFRDVLAGNRDALERTYSVSMSTEGARFALSLRPRDPALREFLRELRFEGEGERVEVLHMIEASGDTTVTRLTRIEPDRAFTPAERAQIFRL